MNITHEREAAPALVPALADVLGELRFAQKRLEEAEHKLAQAAAWVHVADVQQMLRAARRTLGVVVLNLEVVTGAVEVSELATLAAGGQRAGLESADGDLDDGPRPPVEGETLCLAPTGAVLA